MLSKALVCLRHAISQLFMGLVLLTSSENPIDEPVGAVVGVIKVSHLD